MSRKITLCIIIFLLVGIGWMAQRRNEIASKKIAAISLPDTSQFAILPVTHVRWAFGYAQQATLDKKDMLVIENAIRKSVKVYNEQRDSSLRIDLARYKRQYFPGIVASGDRQVLIRCIRDDIIKTFIGYPLKYDWRADNIRINDGGDAIFTMKINLTKRQTYDFVTNGSETL